MLPYLILQLFQRVNPLLRPIGFFIDPTDKPTGLNFSKTKGWELCYATCLVRYRSMFPAGVSYKDSLCPRKWLWIISEATYEDSLRFDSDISEADL